MLSTTGKRSRNYHDYLKIDRLRKKPMTNPLRKEVTAIPCRELLSTISLGISCHPRKRTRKIEKGKKYQIRKRKKTHQIFDIELFSRLRTVPFFRFSLWRESKKIKNKKRVSRTYKVRNSFDKVSNVIEIKRLLEPARSFQGLSLNRFFGFVEYRYSLITYGIK